MKEYMKFTIIGLVIILVGGAFTVRAADRALVVGVDVYADNSIGTTDGATDDARAMRQLLIEKFGFAPASIRMLLDEEATAGNIVSNFRSWLIDGTRPGDRVFFFYAGHGFQVPDDNGDEADGMDEVITPYDVKIVPQGRNILLPDERTFIRDDRFNDFIAELSGRRVVLMFDSCHSGTLSRSAGGNTGKLQSRYLSLKPTRSIVDGGYSDVPADAKSRDLNSISEDGLRESVNGVVILSAASAYQQAFPIVLPGNRMRGAFSYIFENLIRRNPGVRLEDLERDMKREMKIFADKEIIGQSRNGEYQVPQVEIISKIGLADKPLFAGSTAETNVEEAVKYALFNPLSDLRVRLALDKPRYRLGETIDYTVDISADAYLYILVFSAQNQAFCIFPTKIGKDTVNYLKAGRHNFPRDDYVTEATEPVGRDVWVALASKQKLRIGEKEAYSWNEMFDRVGLARLQQEIARRVSKTRGAGNSSITRLTNDDWQADVVVVETTR